MLTHRYTSLALQVALLALIAGTLAYASADWRKQSPVRGPGGTAVATAVTPDASRAATVTADGHISLWDLDKRKLIRSKHLPDGKPIHLAIRDQGDALAVAYENADAVIWWCDGSGKMVRPSVRARLVAFAHQKRLLITVNHPGAIDVYHLDSAKLITGSRQRSTHVPLQVLKILPSDRAAITFRAEGGFSNNMSIDLSTGQKVWTSGISKANINFDNPLVTADGVILIEKFNRLQVSFNTQLVDGANPWSEQMISTYFQPICIEDRWIQSARNSPRSNTPILRHDFAPIMIQQQISHVLTGNTAGDLIAYRRARANDWVTHPAPWLVVPAFFLLGWVMLKRRWARLENPPDEPAPDDAALDLPRPTIVAAWITAILGALMIAGMIYDLATGTCMLNFGILALPAGILLLRKKSNGWRKFAALLAWLTMAAGALLFGVASIGQQPLAFTVGSRVSYQPVWVGVLVSSALFSLGIFLYLALTHPLAQRICRAAAMPEVQTRAARLAAMQTCASCGYNTTQTVIDGRRECPECGATIWFDEEERAWLIDV